MTKQSCFKISQEEKCHFDSIEKLHETVFGPGRFARTAFRVREGCPAEERFCFVATKGDTLSGSVRLTRVSIAEQEAYLLGPLCVSKPEQGAGIGRALVAHALDAVRAHDDLPVILVGDRPYYAPLGFENVTPAIAMPGPVDRSRLLIAWPKATVNREDYQGVIHGVKQLRA